VPRLPEDEVKPGPNGVSFAVDVDLIDEKLYPDWEDPATYLLRAAYGLRNAYIENTAVIGRREFIFRLALLTLGAETLLWALALALT